MTSGKILRRTAFVLTTLLLAACTSMAQRPATSTLGCAQAVVRSRVPPDLPDKATHCVAVALIARNCSHPEAVLVAIGKEFQDLMGAGEAEWADLQADRAGLRCASQSGDDTAVGECCRLATGTQPRLRN